MAASLLGGSPQGKLYVDPHPKQVAKDIARRINKPMKKELGRLHKKLGKTPVDEVKKRAQAEGSGRVRIGRKVRASAAMSDLTILAGGAGYPDFAGQERGSKQYGQFLPWTGGGNDGYVIGAMMNDDGFMEKFGQEYVEGLSDLLKLVWNE